MASLTLSILFLFSVFTLGIDLSGLVHIVLHKADGFILVSLVIAVGLLVDIVRLRVHELRKYEIENHRLDALQCTMHTVHDIMNNFLNSLHLFRMEVERQSSIDPETLEFYDSIIENAARQLMEIDALENVKNREITDGITCLDLDTGTNSEVSCSDTKIHK